MPLVKTVPGRIAATIADPVDLVVDLAGLVVQPVARAAVHRSRASPVATASRTARAHASLNRTLAAQVRSGSQQQSPFAMALSRFGERFGCVPALRA